jgi:hypothetical protein
MHIQLAIENERATSRNGFSEKGAKDQEIGLRKDKVS